MSTLFKHQAAKIRCGAVALPRIWTQLNCLDIKTTYRYRIQKPYPWSPERYSKKTNAVTWTELQAERFQFLHGLVRPAARLVLKSKTSATTLPQESSRVTGGRSSLGCGTQLSQHCCSQRPARCHHCGGWNVISTSTGKCQQHRGKEGIEHMHTFSERRWLMD